MEIERSKTARAPVTSATGTALAEHAIATASIEGVTVEVPSPILWGWFDSDISGMMPQWQWAVSLRETHGRNLFLESHSTFCYCVVACSVRYEVQDQLPLPAYGELVLHHNIAAHLDYIGSATCIETYTLREGDGPYFAVSVVLYLSPEEANTP